jgi:protein Jade-1
MFIRPRKYIVSSGSEPPELGYVDIRTLADSVCRYDLSDMDAAWLELTNEEFKEMGECLCVTCAELAGTGLSGE